MTSPKTPEQLAQAVEALVAAYIDAGKQAATEALDRTFARAPSRSTRGPRPGPVPRERAAGRRRSADEIDALAEKLEELVRVQPGESMSRFAEQLGVPSGDLHRPMSKLKAEARVRSVGQRHQTRYFPALGRRPRE